MEKQNRKEKKRIKLQTVKKKKKKSVQEGSKSVGFKTIFTKSNQSKPLWANSKVAKNQAEKRGSKFSGLKQLV